MTGGLLAVLLAAGAGGAALRGGAARELACTGFDFAGGGFLVAGLAGAGLGDAVFLAGVDFFWAIVVKTGLRKVRAEGYPYGYSGLSPITQGTRRVKFNGILI